MFWNRISLAAIRYAEAHRDHGGPLASISFRQSERLGERVFEAFALLDKGVTGMDAFPTGLYGASHGSGTAGRKSEAVYRAVSEALERWAWHSASQQQESRHRLGLDLDPSTTGFAAFPGLGPRSARVPALLEAGERWALGAWWERRAGYRALDPGPPWEGVKGIELLAPVAHGRVALLWKDLPRFRAYGFAAGTTLPAAVRKAAVELGRNIQVLEFAEGGAAAANRAERRLLFFSGDTGRRAFDQRLVTHSSSPLEAPSLIVDCQVPGPWAKYTHVWRCLFDPAGLHDPGTDDYFDF